MMMDISDTPCEKQFGYSQTTFCFLIFIIVIKMHLSSLFKIIPVFKTMLGLPQLIKTL